MFARLDFECPTEMTFEKPENGFTLRRTRKGQFEFPQNGMPTCSCGLDPLSIFFNPNAAKGEVLEVFQCTFCPTFQTVLKE